jgi:hypothetical protein
VPAARPFVHALCPCLVSPVVGVCVLPLPHPYLARYALLLCPLLAIVVCRSVLCLYTLGHLNSGIRYPRRACLHRRPCRVTSSDARFRRKAQLCCGVRPQRGVGFPNQSTRLPLSLARPLRAAAPPIGREQSPNLRWPATAALTRLRAAADLALLFLSPGWHGAPSAPGELACPLPPIRRL